MIEQASEIAGLIRRTNRLRGYCLEMVCSDFLAGASQAEQREALLLAVMVKCVFVRRLRSETAKGTSANLHLGEAQLSTHACESEFLECDRRHDRPNVRACCSEVSVQSELGSPP